MKPKPCPFCSSTYINWRWLSPQNIAFARCDSCGASGPTNGQTVSFNQGISLSIEDTLACENAAFTAWNVRNG